MRHAANSIRVLVAVPEDRATAAAWKERSHTPFPVLTGRTGTPHEAFELARRLFGMRQSGSVLIDPQGTVRHAHGATSPLNRVGQVAAAKLLSDVGEDGRMSVSMRPVRRPKARWYLLSVLAFLVALPLGVAGVVGLAWQDWQHPDSPVDRATLTRGTSYDLEGVHGDYGDVWARLASGDKVSCAFTATTAGATTFTRTFVVPEQHPPKHRSESRTAGDRDTAQVGTFTAPASGAYRIACTDRGGSEPGPLAVRARQAPSGWPPVALYIAIGLAIAGVVWIVVLLRRRDRSRLLRTALDAGVEVVTG